MSSRVERGNIDDRRSTLALNDADAVLADLKRGILECQKLYKAERPAWLASTARQPVSAVHLESAERAHAQLASVAQELRNQRHILLEVFDAKYPHAKDPALVSQYEEIVRLISIGDESLPRVRAAMEQSKGLLSACMPVDEWLSELSTSDDARVSGILRDYQQSLRAERDRLLASHKQSKANRDIELQRAVEAELAESVVVLESAIKSGRCAGDILKIELCADAVGQRAIRGIWHSLRDSTRMLVQMPDSQLSDEDVRLCFKWAKDRCNSQHKIDLTADSQGRCGTTPCKGCREAMYSARAAELSMLEVYRRLYGEAIDLSILQERDHHDEQWRIADIDVSGRLVDIKNARSAKSSPKRYVEHCVPKFKSNRYGEEIIISAVLSPHITTDGHSIGSPVRWLGETSMSALNELRRQFEKPGLLEIDFSRGASESVFLPGWLFDFPQECYKARDDAVARVRDTDFIFPRSRMPSAVVPLLGKNTCSASEPSSQEMVHEATLLAGRMFNGKLLSRPEVYLHVIHRFCESMITGTTFPFVALRTVIFAAGVFECDDQRMSRQMPCGTLDPLGLIDELLEVLEEAEQYVRPLANDIAMFKMSRAGVLRAKFRSGTTRTVLAYCGGKVDGKVSCGRNPLYVGQSCGKWCDKCWWIVCPTCGHCLCRRQCAS